MLRPTVSTSTNAFSKVDSAYNDVVAPAVGVENKKPMTNDERIDALIRQNDALADTNAKLAQSVQDAIKMAHDTIAANQRQGEANQEVMKQLLSILENSKKNLRAVGVPGATATRTAHG